MSRDDFESEQGTITALLVRGVPGGVVLTSIRARKRGKGEEYRSIHQCYKSMEMRRIFGVNDATLLAQPRLRRKAKTPELSVRVPLRTAHAILSHRGKEKEKIQLYSGEGHPTYRKSTSKSSKWSLLYKADAPKAPLFFRSNERGEQKREWNVGSLR